MRQRAREGRGEGKPCGGGGYSRGTLGLKSERRGGMDLGILGAGSGGVLDLRGVDLGGDVGEYA